MRHKLDWKCCDKFDIDNNSEIIIIKNKRQPYRLICKSCKHFLKFVKTPEIATPKFMRIIDELKLINTDNIENIDHNFFKNYIDKMKTKTIFVDKDKNLIHLLFLMSNKN